MIEETNPGHSGSYHASTPSRSIVEAIQRQDELKAVKKEQQFLCTLVNGGFEVKKEATELWQRANDLYVDMLDHYEHDGCVELWPAYHYLTRYLG